MEKQQLLDTLNALIGRYQQHRQYIDKARAQIGKFNSAVIEKVVLDHEIKATGVAEEVVPLLPQIVEAVVTLEGERSEILASKGSLDEVIQELDLRLLIDELDESGYEKEVADLRDRQGLAADRLSAIDSDIAVYNRIISAWEQLSGQAVVRPSKAAEAVPAAADTSPEADVAAENQAPVAQPLEPDVASQLAAKPESQAGGQDSSSTDVDVSADFGVDLTGGADDLGNSVADLDGDLGGDAVGSHVSVSKIQEDLGAVYRDPIKVNSSVEEDIAIETADVADPGAEGGDIQFSLNDGAEVSVGAGNQGGRLGEEISLDKGGDLGADMGNVGEDVEIDFGADVAAAADSSTSQRRALLLYQEGTPDEQIYPFQNDQLTIGRGRENDIQIKNDSKVSRYHCRISRRGNNFYIEDVKSSNGTLVNGELVTERRLFGGEEVIIGETFFRVRIMD